VKKEKDKFYRKNLKNGIEMTVGLIIIGFMFLFLFSFFMKKDLEFASTAKVTKAEIIDVKYKTKEKEVTKSSYDKINVEDVSYVLIKYSVNNVEYIGILNDIDSSMYIGKNINIYYNQNNPEETVYINYLNDIPMIVIPIILIIGGFIGTINETIKIIRYIETLNGLEIEAKIVKVVEIQKLWGKEYKIECTGKDEAGNVHTFYSRNFKESYLEKEIKKLNLDTLKVRYKKYQPNKYIVLTESLEKRLSR